MSAEETIKVSDLVQFSQKDYIETKRVLKLMNEMVQRYVDNLDNLETLEDLKRKFNGQMVYLAGFYAKVKCYRENHDYLEAQRKRLKADAVKRMVRESEEKLSTAAAKELVYDFPYYKDRLDVLEDIKQFFYKVDLSYSNYQDVQRSIYQSVSLLSKQKDATIS